MLDQYLFQPSVDEESHIIATYYVESRDLLKAAKAIAIGQSIGNPDVRTQKESPELLRYHLAKVLDLPSNLHSKHQGVIKVAYPLVNWDIEEDGISHLICTLMGGQMDIDIINKCQLLDVEFPSAWIKTFKGPKFGMENIRQRAKVGERPLLGGIIKPKTGITAVQLREMVLELCRGGVDFIKEDEILANPHFNRFKERVEIVNNAVNDFCDDEGREIFFTPCINGDYPYFLQRAQYANDLGVRGVHLNIWAGLPAYRALRDLDMKNTAIHFQKSGDKVLTARQHNFPIHWNVLCKLARMMGADFIHAGMWGGYLSDSKEDLSQVMHILKGKSHYNATVPALSCGSHPGLVNTTVKNFGTGLMMNVGGCIQGHPMGAEAGAKAMRQSFECTQKGEDIHEFMKSRPELKAAIEKWGYVK